MESAPHRPPGPAPPEPSESDLALQEGVEAGMVGGLVVILVYLVPDLLAGDWLRTPALLGSLIVHGPGVQESDVSAGGLAAVFTGLHFAAWAVVGFAASALVRLAERTSERRWLLPATFGLWIAAMIAGDLWIAMATSLPTAHLWVGSVVAGVALGAYLFWRHPTASAHGIGTS